MAPEERVYPGLEPGPRPPTRPLQPRREMVAAMMRALAMVTPVAVAVLVMVRAVALPPSLFSVVYFLLLLAALRLSVHDLSDHRCTPDE